MHLMNESKITSASSADCYVQLSCSWVNWSTGRIADMFWLQDWTVGRKVAPPTWRTEPNFLRWDRTSASTSQRAASSFNSILGFLGIFFALDIKLSPKALDATPGVELVQCPCKHCNFLKLRNRSPSKSEKSWGPDCFTGSRRRGHETRIYWYRLYIIKNLYQIDI